MKNKILKTFKIFYEHDILPHCNLRTLKSVLVLFGLLIVLFFSFWLSTHLNIAFILYSSVFLTTIIIGLKWGKFKLNLINAVYLKNINITVLIVVWFDLLLAVIKNNNTGDEIMHESSIWTTVFDILLLTMALLVPLSIVLSYYGKIKKKLGNEKIFIEISLSSKAEVGDKAGMIEEYNKILKIEPDYATGYYYRGNIKLELDDKVGARLDFVKAYELGLWGEYYNRPPDYVLELFSDEHLGVPINNYDRWY